MKVAAPSARALPVLTLLLLLSCSAGVNSPDDSLLAGSPSGGAAEAVIADVRSRSVPARCAVCELPFAVSQLRVLQYVSRQLL
jgi:hypothetical protein